MSTGSVERFVQNIGYLCGRSETLLVRSMSSMMQTWHGSTQKQILSWKKSLDCSRGKIIYSSWDIRMKHTKRCLLTLDGLLALCHPGSHPSLHEDWPVFLSMNGYVSLPHVPNLHHYKRAGNSWAFYYSYRDAAQRASLGTLVSHLSRHHPSAQTGDDLESL